MNLQKALLLVADHYEHAKLTHPEPKTMEHWHLHIEERVNDLYDATEEPLTPNARQIAGKRALQIAAMALRAIEDLGLGLVAPDYDSSNLPHTPVN